ncbi:MAG: 23S rRNA (adenine(2503)-C(2))-methyltransferase RlmN [Myxococcales bacterium]|nr:23S rRNA (adenine(2503)-C(2))-methyltransferase RlmN [Myxococcales bacterium]
MLAIQGYSADDLVAALEVPLAEARRLVSHVRRGGDLAGPVDQVRRTTLERLRGLACVPTLSVVDEERSALDPFRKLVLALAGGERIETVRIPLEKPGRFSVCVSSQVGCALGCTFCATGRLGLKKNLESWEIVEQVRLVAATLGPGQRVHGVVFQGMGEPMANLDRVLQAIRALRDPSGLAVDTRAITVCTSGLPTGIRRLATEMPKVRLGLSLGTAVRAKRRSLMPIDVAHPLDEVLKAAAEHAARTGMSPMFAVTLLSGVNDGVEDADALSEVIHSFAKATGHRPRLSIIPYNAIGGDEPYVRSAAEREDAFRERLRERGVFSHKRYSGGSDVGAACGQLAGRVTA